MGHITNNMFFEKGEEIKVRSIEGEPGKHGPFATVQSWSGENRSELFFVSLDHIREWAAQILVRVSELSEKEVA